jgi:cytidylate kinase
MKPLISFEHFKAFIDHQLKPQPHGPEAPRKPFVTISRQAGAGGSTVSELLVAWLGSRTNSGEWTVFDKALAEKVAEDNALPRRITAYLTEAKRNFIESTVEELLGLHPPIETLVEQTARTILNLAQMGNVILIGRAANLITAKLPQGFHVRLIGSVEKRTIQLANLHGLTFREATQMMKLLDQGRRAYAKNYYHADLENPMHYHMVINTDLVSFNRAAEIIGQEVMIRMPILTKPHLPFLEASNQARL